MTDSKSNITDLVVVPKDASLDSFLATAGMPVVVDFSAKTCVPCHHLHVILERVAAKFVGRVKVVQIDVDDSPECAAHFHVQAVPTLLYFACGKLINRTRGTVPESRLAANFEDLLSLTCVTDDAQEHYKAAVKAAAETRDARMKAAETALEDELLNFDPASAVADNQDLEEAMRPLREAVEAEIADDVARASRGEISEDDLLGKRMAASLRLAQEPRFAEATAKMGAATQAVMELPAFKKMQVETEAAEAEYEEALAAAAAMLTATNSPS